LLAQKLLASADKRSESFYKLLQKYCP